MLAEQLVSKERIEVILDVINRPDVTGLKNARDLLGDTFSFDEIRAVMLGQKRADTAITPGLQ
jgi:hypothetical protein